MGFDLMATNDNHFHANIWSWPVIAAMVEESGVLAETNQEPFNADNSIHGNDGYFVDAESAARIASFIEENLETDIREEFNLPSTCHVDSRGKLMEPGPGTRTAFRVHRSRMEWFVEFCRNCGEGFEVW